MMEPRLDPMRFWQQVFIAAIRARHNEHIAKGMADRALESYRRLLHET